MKCISIVTPCFNEEGNIDELYRRISAVMAELPYDYEHIIIDNCSTDGTVAKLRKLAEQDSRLKVILNARNFGHIRSPYHGILQAVGDAVVVIASDLQDPPELIPDLVRQWDMGFKTVLLVKPQSQESKLMVAIRKSYYQFISRISTFRSCRTPPERDCLTVKLWRSCERWMSPIPMYEAFCVRLGSPSRR